MSKREIPIISVPLSPTWEEKKKEKDKVLIN